MKLKNTRILEIFLVFIGFFTVGALFYFSPLSNFLKKAPESISNIKKEILIPGPLSSEEEKAIKEVLSDNEIIKITNEYRKKYSKNILRENEFLNKAAMERIDDMFLQQYFDHVSPQGTDVSNTLKNVKYSYVIAGENLALGYFADSKDLVDAWMASPGHRENILNSKFREIGVAHKIGIFKGKKQYLAVQVFATSASDCPLPSESLKTEIENKEKEIKNIENTMQLLEGEISTLKSQIDVLYQEINNLIGEGKSLILQGNNLILKGNQIYSQTRDKAAAEEYWLQGETLQKRGQEKIDEANSKKVILQNLQNQLQDKITYYNSLVNQINEKNSNLKNLIIQYNKQVEIFQNCL